MCRVYSVYSRLYRVNRSTRIDRPCQTRQCQNPLEECRLAPFGFMFRAWPKVGRIRIVELSAAIVAQEKLLNLNILATKVISPPINLLPVLFACAFIVRTQAWSQNKR